MGFKERVKFTEELADKHGVEAFKTVCAKAVAWSTYKDEQRYGHMFLRLDKVNIQIFNVNLALWVKSGSLGHVPVQIKGVRLSHDGADGNAPVFVGEVNFELFQKMWENHEKINASKKKVPISGEDMIEVGLVKPRLVTVETFNELVENGCWNCTGIINTKDSDVVHWFGPDENWPLCGTCSSQPQIISEWTKLSREREADRAELNSITTH